MRRAIWRAEQMNSLHANLCRVPAATVNHRSVAICHGQIRPLLLFPPGLWDGASVAHP